MKQAVKIMIADDEPNILMPLEFLMKKEGYQVYVARDGNEAKDLIIKEEPDILILDIMMPGMSGFEVADFVRNESSIKDAKIVFISAKDTEPEVKSGYEMGGDLYISKPFSTRKLVKAIRNFVEAVEY